MSRYPVKNDLRMIAIMLLCLIAGNALAKANEMMDGRVQNMIRQHLVAQGLKEVSANPNLIVSYDASTQNH